MTAKELREHAKQATADAKRLNTVSAHEKAGMAHKEVANSVFSRRRGGYSAQGGYYSDWQAYHEAKVRSLRTGRKLSDGYEHWDKTDRPAVYRQPKRVYIPVYMD